MAPSAPPWSPVAAAPARPVCGRRDRPRPRPPPPPAPLVRRGSRGSCVGSVRDSAVAHKSFIKYFIGNHVHVDDTGHVPHQRLGNANARLPQRPPEDAGATRALACLSAPGDFCRPYGMSRAIGVFWYWSTPLGRPSGSFSFWRPLLSVFPLLLRWGRVGVGV